MTGAKTIPLLLVLLLLVSSASAQRGDWRAVQHIAGGTRLKIKLKHGGTFGHCEFLGATDDELICGYDGFLGEDQRHYSRDNIKGVYLVHNGPATGAVVGAGTGAVFGATFTRGPAANREFGALIGAGSFGLIGYFFGTVLDPFFHGKAVYVDLSPRRGSPLRPTATDRL